ncbi:MAG: Response regulator receiver protein [Phenylobacterium sp.]|nr:Response regulator receiver protein [Phenylobacterium sp.]
MVSALRLMPPPPRETRTASKVLVIDDDPSIRDLIALSLTGQGFSVSTAEDGRVGLQVFAKERPDLVITDILMPDVEGIEIILALKANARPPKVIAISGGGRLVGRDFLTWASRLGADEVLPKPFRMSLLVARVQALLGPEPVAPAPCMAPPDVRRAPPPKHPDIPFVRSAQWAPARPQHRKPQCACC